MFSWEPPWFLAAPVLIFQIISSPWPWPSVMSPARQRLLGNYLQPARCIRLIDFVIAVVTHTTYSPPDNVFDKRYHVKILIAFIIALLMIHSNAYFSYPYLHYGVISRIFCSTLDSTSSRWTPQSVITAFLHQVISIKDRQTHSNQSDYAISRVKQILSQLFLWIWQKIHEHEHTPILYTAIMKLVFSIRHIATTLVDSLDACTSIQANTANTPA